MDESLDDYISKSNFKVKVGNPNFKPTQAAGFQGKRRFTQGFQGNRVTDVSITVPSGVPKVAGNQNKTNQVRDARDRLLVKNKPKDARDRLNQKSQNTDARQKLMTKRAQKDTGNKITIRAQADTGPVDARAKITAKKQQTGPQPQPGNFTLTRTFSNKTTNNIQLTPGAQGDIHITKTLTKVMPPGYESLAPVGRGDGGPSAPATNTVGPQAGPSSIQNITRTVSNPPTHSRPPPQSLHTAPQLAPHSAQPTQHPAQPPYPLPPVNQQLQPATVVTHDYPHVNPNPVSYHPGIQYATDPYTAQPGVPGHTAPPYPVPAAAPVHQPSLYPPTQHPSTAPAQPTSHVGPHSQAIPVITAHATNQQPEQVQGLRPGGSIPRIQVANDQYRPVPQDPPVVYQQFAPPAAAQPHVVHQQYAPPPVRQPQYVYPAQPAPQPAASHAYYQSASAAQDPYMQQTHSSAPSQPKESFVVKTIVNDIDPVAIQRTASQTVQRKRNSLGEPIHVTSGSGPLRSSTKNYVPIVGPGNEATLPKKKFTAISGPDEPIIKRVKEEQVEDSDVNVISPLQGYKVVITNLATSVTQDDIIELFGAIGGVKSVKLIKPGVSEVVYVKRENASTAVSTYHQRELDGLPMQVRMATPASARVKEPAQKLPATVKPPVDAQPLKLGGKKPVAGSSKAGAQKGVEVGTLHKALFKMGAPGPSKPVTFTVNI